MQAQRLCWFGNSEVGFLFMGRSFGGGQAAMKLLENVTSAWCLAQYSVFSKSEARILLEAGEKVQV